MAKHNLNRVTGIVLIIFFSLLSAFGQTRKDSLIVFVGEKIKVKYVKRPIKGTRIEGKDTIHFIRMDNEYLAKYKILQLVHGSYISNTIVFTVFDHYGKPAFSRYQTVLLFVSYYNGKLYHEKYQYFDLYMTECGKWASPYSFDAYDYPSDSITVIPEKILFKKEVSFPIFQRTDTEDEEYTIMMQRMKELYPKPYYEIKNKRAIAKYGNYVDDLFKLKQQTVLKE